MTPFVRSLFLAMFFAGRLHAAPATIFTDSFEGAQLGAPWSVTQTNDGRVAITTEHGPATGTKHLVLDDAVSDPTFSVAEATLKVDLKDKKNVMLTFKAKSLGNEPHAPPLNVNTNVRTYDGVAVSTNGGTTWRFVTSLAGVGTSWESFSVNLDAAVAALGGGYGSNFLIRFSGYDNAGVPVDGIAVDDVSVVAEPDQRILLELPDIVQEGSGPYTAYLLLAFPPETPLTVTLAASPSGQIVAPETVTVAAGETFKSFEFTVADDALVNLTRTVTVTPSAIDTTAFGASLTIRDDESPPSAVLTLPASVTEGLVAANNASISLSFAISVPVTFTLSANPTSEITFPATVTVPAGQSQAVFTVQAVNDTKLDGNVTVTVTAAALHFNSASAQTTAIDNEQPAVSLTLPATITEGTTATATLTMSGAVQTNTTINLSSSSATTLSVPSSVTIPAGQTEGTFAMTAVDDAAVNLQRTVTVTASGTAVTGTSGMITVTDDETAPVLTLTLPDGLTEGDLPTNNATLTLSSAAAVTISVTLSATPLSELTLPASVSIPAGQTQVAFTARAANDTRIDGNVNVTVTASAPGLLPSSAQTVAVDNEQRVLSISLPATLQEGASGTGSVTVSGTLTNPLQVTLINSLPDQFTIPATVTIAAGQTQASFSASAVENGARDGSRNVTVTATAPTFPDATRSVMIRDNDPGSYQFGAITDLVNPAVPLNVTITARDVEGNQISGYTGTVNLRLVLPDGSTQSVTPATANLSGSNGWSGTVTLPAVNAQPLVLRATDSAGASGDSGFFEYIRMMDLAVNDLLWDAPRGRLYASVPATATSPHANKVVVIDPNTMTVTGSVTTNQDPGQLALTSGGEYLYVALKNNGTIAKLNPNTLSVISTFAVGTDPSYGTLYANDICTVQGQPEVLIISQFRKSVSPSHNGVAAYDNGVIRPTKTQDHTGSDIIEPSADPTIYFGYNTGSSEFGFRRLKLSPNGMSQLEVNGTLFSGYSANMRSDGDRVYSTTGVGVDGALMRRLGTFSANGIVCPDRGSGRVFYVEQTIFSSFEKISAHDPVTFSVIRRLTMPAISNAGNLVRWGSNGLAFRAGNSVALVSSSRLVPSDAPADLATTLSATPNFATVNQPLTYTATTTNSGPNIAKNVVLLASLGDSQSIQSTSANAGSPVVSGNVVTLAISELAVGESATLTVTVSPQSAGSLTCTASVNSDAVDPDFTNNLASKVIGVGFQSAVDVVNVLRLPANDLIYDPTRQIIWASIPNTVPAPLGRSIISIDPMSGLMSDPIPINANPTAGSLALSGNGRYLYVGLTDVSEIHRIDLSNNSSIRIPLGLSQWGSANFAQDIEVLDGDGTSIIMAGSGDHAAAVYDGGTMRPTRTGIYTVDRLERTATAGVFVGYNNYTSGFQTTRMSVGASGISVLQSVGSLITGYYVDIRGSGNLLLSSSGHLVDSSNLTLKTNFAISGRPAVDAAYQRAYLVNGNALRAFSATDGTAAGTLPLPTTGTGDWAKICIRWGVDGFAILGNDGKVYFARWSQTIPEGMDQNEDGFDDNWAAMNFASLDVDPNADGDGDGIADGLEYLFGTSPVRADASPIRAQRTTYAGEHTLHLIFPRRTGLRPDSYAYACSLNCTSWQDRSQVIETVLSKSTVDGVEIEMIDAAIPFGSASAGFGRIKWKNP